MDKMGAPNVTVMNGHMDGPLSTEPSACQLGVVGVAWNGRRYVVVQSFFRDKSTFFGFKQVYELKGATPVLFLDGAKKHAPLCQEGRAGAPEPPGWRTFPDELQALFCH
jgi:hypothetical protein